MSDEVDAVVIGLGPGGESAAMKLAEAGLRVLGAEERLVGGECPYYGCIPSKMVIRAANLLAEARRVPGMAGETTVTPDYGPVAARIRDEATDDWDDRVAVERLEQAGVEVVHDHARLAGPRTVEVAGRTVEARRGVLLNTGTAPAAPPIPGLDGSPYWTNRDILRIETVPASLAVIGGGAIGLELAQALSRFGVDVTVIEVADRLLALEEPEASRLITDVFGREGIQVLTGVQVRKVEYDDGRFAIDVGGQVVAADRLLVAAGRRPNLGDIGLETVGLDPGARTIETDGRLRAGEGLWAIGDITGKGAFTHMSMYQSAIAVRDILGEDGPEADYHAVPRVTFTDPEVGAVGMTERQARDAGLSIRVAVSDLTASARGWIHKAGNDGLIKVVEDTDRGVLVGATSIGPSGGEVLGALAVAVQAKVPTAALRAMPYAYPTFHRAIDDALSRL